MFQAAPAKAPSIAPLGRPIDQPSAYSPIPQRLITDLHDNPLAIGLYGFIARLYLVAQSPIPLSVPDVLRYDPTLSRGAVLRAIARLVAGGWLIEAAQPGLKTRYTPAWGRVSGAVLAWDMQQSCLGRPRHVARLRLDRRLFDICMGKLVPHATRAAAITRYVTIPVLALADVGCYALALAGLTHTTPALLRLGAVREGAAQPLPSDQRILALISQRALDLGEAAGAHAELTVSGTRKLGVHPLLAPDPSTETVQPLFFVPPGMIGCLIQPLIGSMIGDTAPNPSPVTAAAADKMRSELHAEGITWEYSDPRDAANSPPAPTHYQSNRGGAADAVVQQTPRQRQAPASLALPNTEAAAALQMLNVKPAQIIELAHMPLESVTAAITDGRTRPGIRDLAGWVVSLLRAQRDYGWKITPPAPAPDSPAALSAAFARYAAEQEAALCPEADQITYVSECAEEDVCRAAAAIAQPLPLVRLWNDVQAAMRTRITRQEFANWVRPAVLQSVAHGVASISVPSARIKDGLEQRYSLSLGDLFTMLLGSPTQVRVIVYDELAVAQAHPTAAGVDALAIDVQSPTATPSSPVLDHRPDWIRADQWSSLPAMLRAALIGSTVIDGAVQAISPHLTRLIATRYMHEVAALIAVIEPALVQNQAMF